MHRLTRLLLLLALFCPVISRADQNDQRLDELFMKLKSAQNATQAYPIEASIWDIWAENGNARYQNMLMTGIAQMNGKAMAAALATFTQLIELAPDYAEAWNQRATLYYLTGDYKASEADIAQVLKLEPYHFGALSGLGLVHLAQKEYFLARNAFHDALEVYPTMEGVKANLQVLDAYLRSNTI